MINFVDSNTSGYIYIYMLINGGRVLEGKRVKKKEIKNISSITEKG